MIIKKEKRYGHYLPNYNSLLDLSVPSYSLQGWSLYQKIVKVIVNNSRPGLSEPNCTINYTGLYLGHSDYCSKDYHTGG